MNTEELNEVLRLHKLWLQSDPDGKRADLSRADLSGADLSGSNLSGANLSRSNLSGADLSGADLSRADLSGADLSGADLSGADLSGANLSRSNLSGADLSGADLSGANLSGANLSRSNLSGSNLSGANLSGANLSGAKGLDNLRDTCSILPDGELIGWKKLLGGKLCTLKIPAEARRSNSTGRKCRAEYADVLEGEGVSSYDHTFEYRVGQRVTCDKWNEDWTVECGGGIHFFITRSEAEQYVL